MTQQYRIISYFGFQHPDLKIQGSARAVGYFEGVLLEVTPGAAYTPVDSDGHVVVDLPPEVYKIIRLAASVVAYRLGL